MSKSHKKRKRHAAPQPRRERPADRCPVCGGPVHWTGIAPVADLGLTGDALRRLRVGQIVRLDPRGE